MSAADRLDQIEARTSLPLSVEGVMLLRKHDVPALVAALRAVLDLKSEYGAPRYVSSTDIETTITEALNG